MNPLPRSNWQTLEPLLDQALELAPEARSRWLAELSVSSPELAADVEAFLAEEAAADRSGFLTEVRDVSLAGLELGAYRLERQVGQGGMGTVWLAQRADGRFEGQAAVKLLNLALVSATGQERFRREGSVLARLAHPGIARLLDAGVSPAGQPYLVLEYVDGQPIDLYVRERKLPQAALLRLFLQVLAAVGHAHASLIVHRDLKPSNIFVTTDGTVKLLDFGIAKLIDDESVNDRSLLTAAGGRIFTPHFAAPEQVHGADLTTATDVYALGVLLYVLLSGRHPTAEGARSPAECVTALVEAEPARLGLGDLDTILAKALRKPPGERYQTVAAFGDDLERYLRREPVSARPQSLGYRLAKFASRNRVAVVAGLATTAGLLGATAFSIGQMREAQLQRDEARAQRDRAVYEERRATASSGFMEFLLQSIAPSGRAYTLQEMLDHAREILERDYREDPRFTARMMIELAESNFKLHDRKRELALLTRAEELAGRSGDLETAAYANCRLGKSAADDGDATTAQVHLDRGRGYLERIAKPAAPPQVQCLRTHSALTRLLGHTDSALASARKAVALSEASGDTSSIKHLSAVNEVARALHDDGQVRAALEVTRQILGVLRRTGRDHTIAMVVEQYNEGAMLSRLGDNRAADSALGLALELASGINPDRRVPTYLTLLAADLAGDMGLPDSAVRTYRRALAETRLQSDESYETRTLAELTSALIDQGRLREARASYAELGKIVPDQLHWRLDLLDARLRYAAGEVVDGRRRYLEVLATRGFPGRGISTSYFPRLTLSAALMALEGGDAVAADSLASRVLQLAADEGHDPSRSVVVGRALVTLARARRAQGDLPGARAALIRAVPPLNTTYGLMHLQTMEAHALLDSLAEALPHAAR